MAYAPVHGLNLCACLQVDDAVGKEVEHLLANLFCIVPVFQHIVGRQVVPDIIEVLYQLV